MRITAPMINRATTKMTIPATITPTIPLALGSVSKKESQCGNRTSQDNTNYLWASHTHICKQCCAQYTSAFWWSAPSCICLTSTCSNPKECIAINTAVGHCPCECCGCWCHPTRSIGNRQRSPTVHSCVYIIMWSNTIEHTWTLWSSTIPPTTRSTTITSTDPHAVSVY